MNEDNNTEETTLEQALANDDNTTNVVPFPLDPSNTVTCCGGFHGEQVVLNANAVAVNPYPVYGLNTLNLTANAGSYYGGMQVASSGTAYVNISPADFATIRTMIREELQSIKGEIVKQVKDELMRDVRMSMGMRSNHD